MCSHSSLYCGSDLDWIKESNGEPQGSELDTVEKDEMLLVLESKRILRGRRKVAANMQKDPWYLLFFLNEKLQTRLPKIDFYSFHCLILYMTTWNLMLGQILTYSAFFFRSLHSEVLK